jgi:transposase
LLGARAPQVLRLDQAHASPLAKEAIQRIAELYAIESEIRGRSPDERRAARQARSQPLLDSMRTWFESRLPELSRKSDTTAAIRYTLALWDALGRYIAI